MKKILTYLTLFLLTSTTAIAQNFPVQSNLNITPPYSVYLSDYASITSDKLLVTLMLKDVNQSDIQVKLRLTIKGNNIEIRTKAEYLPQPLLLQGGAPLLISGTELESYLNPANLDFSGISKSEFTKTGKLPEGVYQFIVEAVEYRRNVTVSNAGMTVGWLVLNDPPRWTLPMANSLLTATYPQNVFFSWMPMSTASPNAAFTTEYEFTIVELWPDDRSPGDAINSSIPLYQVATNNTSLLYGPAEPELTPGRKYVCRLRAYDTEGRDLFKNKGYSELLVFTFGQSCKPPNVIQHQVLGPEDARVNWTSQPGNTQFVLSYAEQNADGTWSNWYHNETLMPTSNIKGLKAEHTYRYQLKAICGTLESEYSDIKQFSTPAPDTNQVECGKDISIPSLDDSPPLPMLKVGNIINVGGFEARVVEVEGANGTFSGKCVVNVKTFGGVRILSEFENISVNESHQVTAGEINSVKGELNIIGLDEIIADVKDVFDNTETDPNVGDPYVPGDPVTIVIDGQTVTVSGDTTFTTPDGTEVIVTLSGQPPIVTVDGEPTEVTTDKLDFDNPNTVTDDGNLAHASSDTTAYSIDYVQFNAFQEPDGKTPGFDAYDHGITAYRNEYKDKKVNDQEYIIPWQSIEANGKPARVNMLIDTKVPDSIQTRLKVEMKGMPLSFLASPDGDTIRILNLVGQGNKDRDLITASYIKDDGDEVPIGYLNLMSYESQSKNVVIVPVDGEFKYQAAALQAFLNKVYAPAMVSWNVQVADKPLEVGYNEGEANGLNTSRTFFSSFNEEMKKVIKAMESLGDNDKNTYYLFVMDKAENESLNGLMPFNSKYGFLFTGDGPDQTHLFRTVAHELGHGAFKLRHNFDKFKEIEKLSTQNLMDYTITPETATILRKFQWDEIISPRLIALGWSEEKYAEGEGEDPLEIIKQKSKILFQNGGVYGIYYKKKCSEKLTPLQTFSENDKITFVFTKNYFKNLIILYNAEGETKPIESIDELGSSIHELEKLESLPDQELYINLATEEFIDCSEFASIIKEDFCSITELTKEFVDDLYEAVNACTKIHQNRFIDFTESGLSAEITDDFNKRLKKCKQAGIDAKYYLTSTYTSSKYQDSIKQIIGGALTNEIILWYELSEDNKEITLKEFKVGEDAVKVIKAEKVENEGYNLSRSASAMLEYMQNNESAKSQIKFGIEFGIDYLELMAALINELKIPPKYWNPDLDAYNPCLFRIYQVIFFQLSLTDSHKITIQKNFASTCGFYNGMVEMIASVPETGAFLVKLFSDTDFRKKFVKQLEDLHAYCEKFDQQKTIFIYLDPGFVAGGVSIIGYGNCAWDALSNYYKGKEVFVKYHDGGMAIFMVATIIVGTNKFAQFTDVSKMLDLLDVFSLGMKATKPLLSGFFRSGNRFLKYLKGSKLFRFVKANGDKIDNLEARWVEVADIHGNKQIVGVDEGVDIQSLDKKIEIVSDPETGKNWQTEDGNRLVEFNDGKEGQLFPVITKSEFAQKLRNKIFKNLEGNVDLQTKFITDFGNDIEKLAKFEANPKFLDNWQKIMNAAKNGAPILRKDMDIITSLSKFDEKLLSKIGPNRFDNFIKKLIEANPNCKTCGGRGDVLVGNMNDVLDDLRNVVISQGKALKADGSFVEGFSEFMTEAGEQASKAKAAALTLKKMSRNWNELTNGGWELHRFEGRIPDIETRHKLDALLKRTNPNTGAIEYKSLEMKNWKSARSVSGDTYTQFKAYIIGGNKFEYYFSAGLTDAMKGNFQNVFKDATKARELWNLNPDFFRALDRTNITSVEDVIDLANDGDLIELINWVK